MSSIDLVIRGMLLEKPQSAYMIQKDVEAHHFSRWTKASTPSIYKKVLQLKAKGYLQSESVKEGTAICFAAGKEKNKAQRTLSRPVLNRRFASKPHRICK